MAASAAGICMQRYKGSPALCAGMQRCPIAPYIGSGEWDLTMCAASPPLLLLPPSPSPASAPILHLAHPCTTHQSLCSIKQALSAHPQL